MSLTNENIKQVRSINYHDGRLAAIKYLRFIGLSHEQAKNAHRDIITKKPWTKPEIKPDINMWENSFRVHL